jgi:hypothetical protein
MRQSVNQASPLSAPDLPLVLLALALLLIGLVAISSASIEYAEWHFQNPWYHSERHLIYLLLESRRNGELSRKPTFGCPADGGGCLARWRC